ncbi:MAG TPA: DUF1570 domain-containing protein [Pirellulales bacterium]|nr:DUF1570 domain-containing protein [Pirellulales bacterium]
MFPCHSRGARPQRKHSAPRHPARVGLDVRCRLLPMALIGILALAARPAPAETLAEASARLAARYAGQLEELAAWCETNDLADEAEITRGWPLPRAPLTLVVPLVGSEVDAPREGDQDPPAKAAEWRKRFTKLRKEQGSALFALAVRAAGEKQGTLAYRLVYATLREDLSHQAARKLLGYKLHDGRWLTAYEVQKAQGNQVWHDQFGWLPRTQVERYEAGQRYYKRRWIKAAEEAKLRADIKHGWDIVTEHYQVSTNHSLEEGVRLAARLERLQQVWRQLFVRFYLSDEQIGRIFKGGVLPKSTKRHLVICFRSRDEYVRALIGGPHIGITNGYYDIDLRSTYFFAGGEGDEQDDSNLYHEATHQLFVESRPTSPKIGHAANFWIVEGIACYMESLTVGRGPLGDRFGTLGGAGQIRLKNARARLLNEDFYFYVPLAELTRLGRDALQRDERIKQLYGQASGLTYFLIHGADGRYRDALVDYLVTVYTAHDTPTTLAELTERCYSELDREYREFLQGAEEAAGGR